MIIEADAVVLSGLRCECCGRMIGRGERAVYVLTAERKFWLCESCEGLPKRAAERFADPEKCLSCRRGCTGCTPGCTPPPRAKGAT